MIGDLPFLFIYWNDFIRRETIDNNNKGNNRYALHNGINKLDMKSKHHQSIPYETLFQHILGLFQVQFNSYKAFLALLSLMNMVENFIGSHSVVINEALLHKDTLLVTVYVRNERFNFVG